MLIPPTIDWFSWAGRLNQLSLLPFLAFLWTISRLPDGPKRMIHGWYLYIIFIAVAVPAGIYSKTQLGTSMANVDWIHGPCELLLTLANLFIVLGLRDALRTASAAKESTAAAVAGGEAELRVHQQQQQHHHQQQQDALTDMQYMQQLHTIYSSKHSMDEPPSVTTEFGQSTPDVTIDVTKHVTFPDDISRPRGPDRIVPHAVRVRRVVPAASVARAGRVASRYRAVEVAHGRLAAAVGVSELTWRSVLCREVCYM